ncbi:MAG: hypothetical protein VZQ80_00300 [Lachnospiraceae bacterium]|nr:hypothetical protein [Lachnospiraceae bacterium]
MAEEETKDKAVSGAASGNKPSSNTGKKASDGAEDAGGKKGKKQDDEVNTRPIPIIITLAAAAVSCIISVMQHAKLEIYVGRLLITVIIFGAIGITVRVILDRYFFNTKENEEESADADASLDGKKPADAPSDEGDETQSEEGGEEENS